MRRPYVLLTSIPLYLFPTVIHTLLCSVMGYAIIAPDQLHVRSEPRDVHFCFILIARWLYH